MAPTLNSPSSSGYTEPQTEGSSNNPIDLTKKDNIGKMRHHRVRGENKPYTRVKQEYNEPVCTICLDKLNERTVENVTTQCMHVFHAPCLIPWVEMQKQELGAVKCPTCSTEQNPESIRHILSFKPSEIRDNNEAIDSTQTPLSQDQYIYSESINSFRRRRRLVGALTLGGALAGGYFIHQILSHK